jgi:hypothetical protein
MSSGRFREGAAGRADSVTVAAALASRRARRLAVRAARQGYDARRFSMYSNSVSEMRIPADEYSVSGPQRVSQVETVESRAHAKPK